MREAIAAPLLTSHTEVAFAELATEQLFAPLLTGLLKSGRTDAIVNGYQL